MNKYVYVPMETFKNTECSSVLTQNVLGLWSTYILCCEDSAIPTDLGNLIIVRSQTNLQCLPRFKISGFMS